MIEVFFPFLLAAALALLIPVAMIALSYVTGPRKLTPIKMEPYECGVPSPTQSARGKLSVKFFTVAMLFLIFDIEIVFLFPWAVVFKSLGPIGLLEMGLFVFALTAGLVYAWKRGALEWE